MCSLFLTEFSFVCFYLKLCFAKSWLCHIVDSQEHTKHNFCWTYHNSMDILWLIMCNVRSLLFLFPFGSKPGQPFCFPRFFCWQKLCKGYPHGCPLCLQQAHMFPNSKFHQQGQPVFLPVYGLAHGGIPRGRPGVFLSVMFKPSLSTSSNISSS